MATMAKVKSKSILSSKVDSSQDAFLVSSVVRLSANAPMLAHRQGYSLLDRNFALIEGHPAARKPQKIA